MNLVKKTGITALIFVLSLMAFITGCGNAANPGTGIAAERIELTVCAGVGLTDVLTEINGLYTAAHKNITIIPNFAASGTLQKQIEQGAPADVFFSPGVKQMNSLQSAGFILTETRQDLLANKIVLVIPEGSERNISDFTGLLDNGVKRIAIGDPEFVPAGNFAMQALDFYGISEQLKTKLILCNDVRQVLSYVEAGNVDAGIVYATDAVLTDKVKVIADAPAEINSKIAYPIAVVKSSKNIDVAKAYITFLSSDEAKRIFEKHGFVVV